MPSPPEWKVIEVGPPVIDKLAVRGSLKSIVWGSAASLMILVSIREILEGSGQTSTRRRRPSQGKDTKDGAHVKAQKRDQGLVDFRRLARRPVCLVTVDKLGLVHCPA